MEKRATQPESGHEVADLKSDTQDTHDTKERSIKVHPRKRAIQPDSGYEVAKYYLEKDPHQRHETSTRSKRLENIRKFNPSSYRQLCTIANTIKKRLDPSRHRQFSTRPYRKIPPDIDTPISDNRRDTLHLWLPRHRSLCIQQYSKAPRHHCIHLSL